MRAILMVFCLSSGMVFGAFIVPNDSITINKLSNQNVAAREIKNCTIATSVGSNALTIALKNNAGANPSAASPCQIMFRSTTASAGDLTSVKATAATSVVVSSGSTLGCTSAVDCFLYVYAINNSGSIELGVINGLLDETVVQSSTAEGGNADNAKTLYSTTARSSKAVRLIGKIRIQESTAGTWASNATDVISQPNIFSVGAISWSGYHDSTCSWSRTNTAYGEPSADATCNFTEVTNSNFPTVSSHTSGGNNLPGLTFTTVVGGTYRICANADVYGGSAGHRSGIRLVDGSSNFYADAIMVAPGNQYSVTMPVCAVAKLTSGQSVTFKFEIKNDSGTVTIGNVAYGTVIDWNITRTGE